MNVCNHFSAILHDPDVHVLPRHPRPLRYRLQAAVVAAVAAGRHLPRQPPPVLSRQLRLQHRVLGQGPSPVKKVHKGTIAIMNEGVKMSRVHFKSNRCKPYFEGSKKRSFKRAQRGNMKKYVNEIDNKLGGGQPKITNQTYL